jgi:hypothetical protein
VGALYTIDPDHSTVEISDVMGIGRDPVLPLQKESIHGERKAKVARDLEALQEQILEGGDIERGSVFT